MFGVLTRACLCCMLHLHHARHLSEFEGSQLTVEQTVVGSIPGAVTFSESQSPLDVFCFLFSFSFFSFSSFLPVITRCDLEIDRAQAQKTKATNYPDAHLGYFRGILEKPGNTK